MNQLEYIKKQMGGMDLTIKYVDDVTNLDREFSITIFEDFICIIVSSLSMDFNFRLAIIGSYGLKFLYLCNDEKFYYFEDYNQLIKDRSQVDSIIQDWYDSIMEKWYLNQFLNEELNSIEADLKTTKKKVSKV